MLAWPTCSCAIFTGTLKSFSVVAEIGPRHPVRLIFVRPRLPLAGEVDLRHRRRGDGNERAHEHDEHAARQLRRIGGSFRAYGLHGVGSHFFAPSASFLKCVLVTNSCARYFGSETTVVTTSHSSPSDMAKRSKYSVIVAPSL